MEFVLASRDEVTENSPICIEPIRKSSSLHKAMIAKLRPLPFQYIWSIWHTKPNPTSIYILNLLADYVADIATFYRIFNNIPWDQVRTQASIHVFRAGLKPLWEEKENLNGGCWVIKVRKEGGRAIKLWEEICLMCCGGELQAAISSEHDHVLGVSFSPRLFWAHISIWTKQGDNLASVEMLEHAILDGLSSDLRPKSNNEYYYKKHSNHNSWREAIEALK